MFLCVRFVLRRPFLRFGFLLVRLGVSFAFLLLRANVLIRVGSANDALTFNDNRRFLCGFLGHVNVALCNPNREPAPRDARARFLRFGAIPVFFKRSIVVDRGRVSVCVRREAFLNGVRQRSEGVFRASMLPSVRLDPITW